MATCCICFDPYDKEYAKALTASCGHSICAQCSCKLRIACMKKGMPARCWVCMKPHDGPLYRTFELESRTPRTETPRFLNPLMTDDQMRQEILFHSQKYADIELPNFTPEGEDEDDDIIDIAFYPAPIRNVSVYPAGVVNPINGTRHHPYRSAPGPSPYFSRDVHPWQGNPYWADAGSSNRTPFWGNSESSNNSNRNNYNNNNSHIRAASQPMIQPPQASPQPFQAYAIPALPVGPPTFYSCPQGGNPNIASTSAAAAAAVYASMPISIPPFAYDMSGQSTNFGPYRQ